MDYEISAYKFKKVIKKTEKLYQMKTKNKGVVLKVFEFSSSFVECEENYGRDFMAAGYR